MAAQIDLHGAEVISLPSQAAPITFGAASIVGLVGGAPNAQSAVAASAVIGEGVAAIEVTADTAGVAGNAFSIELIDPGANGVLAVTLAGDKITVKLAYASSAVTSTAASVVAAINTVQNIPATAALATGGAGGTVLAATAEVSFAGGRDDPAPLNTPMLVNTPAAAAVFGATGTLRAAIDDVWRTAGRGSPVIVAVRTADDMPATIAGARIGGTGGRGTGLYALLDAESLIGQRPRIIAAPGSQANSVAVAIDAVAQELRGIGVVSIDAADAAAAITGRPGGRLYACWPKLRILSAAAGGETDRPPDGLVAGHICRVDQEEGWHHSPSNRQLVGVIRTSIPVDWRLDSRSATANLLSRAFVATAVRRDAALYLWGNRLCDGMLITHRRVRDLVDDALLEYIADYIDRTVDVPFVEFVLGKMRGFLRTQVLRRRLSGGRAWFDPSFNTPSTLAANQVTFSFDLGLYNVAEQITFRSSVTDIYNKQIIEQLAEA